MQNLFSEQMSKRTNAELLKILNKQRNDYEAEAVLAAEEELGKRNLSEEQVATAKDELEKKKQSDDKKANVPLDITWKILTAMLPGLITIIFSKTLIADGYDRKARELVRWTLYGFCFYAALVLLVMIFG